MAAVGTAPAARPDGNPQAGGLMALVALLQRLPLDNAVRVQVAHRLATDPGGALARTLATMAGWGTADADLAAMLPALLAESATAGPEGGQQV